jgi:hypothetical protein
LRKRNEESQQTEAIISIDMLRLSVFLMGNVRPAIVPSPGMSSPNHESLRVPSQISSNDALSEIKALAGDTTYDLETNCSSREFDAQIAAPGPRHSLKGGTRALARTSCPFLNVVLLCVPFAVKSHQHKYAPVRNAFVAGFHTAHTYVGMKGPVKVSYSQHTKTSEASPQMLDGGSDVQPGASYAASGTLPQADQ